MPANDNICPHQKFELELIDLCEASGLDPVVCIAVMGKMTGAMLYALPHNPVEVIQMWHANVTIGNAVAKAAAEGPETVQ